MECESAVCCSVLQCVAVCCSAIYIEEERINGRGVLFVCGRVVCVYDGAQQVD